VTYQYDLCRSRTDADYRFEINISHLKPTNVDESSVDGIEMSVFRGLFVPTFEEVGEHVMSDGTFNSGNKIYRIFQLCISLQEQTKDNIC